MSYRKHSVLLTLAALAALAVFAGGCGEDDKKDPAVSVTFEVVSAALVPAQPKPGEAVTARVVLKNTSDTTWTAARVSLVEHEASGFGISALTLVSPAAAGANATFEAALTAPAREGRYAVVLRPKVDADAVGATVKLVAETSCSNGVFCDGIERFVDGACGAGFAPCDDAQACTTDTCDEATDSLRAHARRRLRGVLLGLRAGLRRQALRRRRLRRELWRLCGRRGLLGAQHLRRDVGPGQLSEPVATGGRGHAAVG